MTELIAGKISLMGMPLWPRGLNSKGDLSSEPVLRSVRRFPPGYGLPSYSASLGL